MKQFASSDQRKMKQRESKRFRDSNMSDEEKEEKIAEVETSR
jgi:hypothetical protein